jgi:hypothetical protein
MSAEMPSWRESALASHIRRPPPQERTPLASAQATAPDSKALMFSLSFFFFLSFF